MDKGESGEGRRAGGLRLGDRVWWWVRTAGAPRPRQMFGAVAEINEDGTLCRVRLDDHCLHVIRRPTVEVKRLTIGDRRDWVPKTSNQQKDKT